MRNRAAASCAGLSRVPGDTKFNMIVLDDALVGVGQIIGNQALDGIQAGNRIHCDFSKFAAVRHQIPRPRDGGECAVNVGGDNGMDGQPCLKIYSGNAGEGFGNENVVGECAWILRAGKKRMCVCGGDLAAQQVNTGARPQQIAQCSDIVCHNGQALEAVQQLCKIAAGLPGAEEDAVAIADMLAGLFRKRGPDVVVCVGKRGRQRVFREQRAAINPFCDTFPFQMFQVFADGDLADAEHLTERVDGHLFLHEKQISYFFNSAGH